MWLKILQNLHLKVVSSALEAHRSVKVRKNYLTILHPH